MSAFDICRVAVSTRNSARVSSSLSLAAQAESAGSEESRDRGITEAYTSGPSPILRQNRTGVGIGPAELFQAGQPWKHGTAGRSSGTIGWWCHSRVRRRGVTGFVNPTQEEVAQASAAPSRPGTAKTAVLNSLTSASGERT